MIHTEFVQGSPEWLEYKTGKISASNIIEIKESRKAGRANYMAKLAAEITTGQREDTFKSEAMQHGNDTEMAARIAYEIKTGNMVQEVGFVDHPEIDGAGCSPDGIINPDGGLEIKCPNTATHIETLKTCTIKTEYIWQMQFCMMCTGAKWWDFVSFDDRLPENCQLFIKRVHHDDKLCAEIESLLKVFKAELSAMVDFLLLYNGGTNE